MDKNIGFNWLTNCVVDNTYKTQITSYETTFNNIMNECKSYMSKFDDEKSISSCPDWKIEYCKDISDFIKDIKDPKNLSFTFEKFKSNHVYVYSANFRTDSKELVKCQFCRDGKLFILNPDGSYERKNDCNENESDSENIRFTYFYIYSFVDSPVISGYRTDGFDCNSISKLCETNRVKVLSYGNKYGLIAFFSEDGNLQIIMQISTYDNTNEDTKNMIVNWTKGLLYNSSKDECEEEEHVPPTFHRDRHVISKNFRIIEFS